MRSGSRPFHDMPAAAGGIAVSAMSRGRSPWDGNFASTTLIRAAVNLAFMQNHDRLLPHSVIAYRFTLKPSRQGKATSGC